MGEPEDTLARLKTTDTDLLTQVVRQDQSSPAFDLLDWSVRPLSDKGIANPRGLWVFSGQGRDGAGSRPWSVVLKLFARPEQTGPQDGSWYWKREIELARSDLATRLPPPLRAARAYLAEETATGASLWMEHIHDSRVGPWPLELFVNTARAIGSWHGLAAGGEAPHQAWLARSHYRTSLSWVDPDECFGYPLFLEYVSPADRARCEHLWATRESLFAVLDGLPLHFSHFDMQRRNLLHTRGGEGPDELVILDWALCGLGPLGAELSNIVGMSSGLLEWPPERLQDLEDAAFPAYLEGLRGSGWAGKKDTVRLGYTGWVGAWIGCSIPGVIRFWCAPETREAALKAFGVAEVDLLRRALHVLTYSLDRADEAFGLIGA